MNNALSHNSSYVREFYLRIINDLIGPRGILSKYLVGFEFDELESSSIDSKDNRVFIALSLLHSIDLPEIGIQKNITYDCFIGSEKKPMLRFRIDQNGKATLLFASKQMIRPHTIRIVESKGESHENNGSVSSNLIERVREIFSSKK